MLWVVIGRKKNDFSGKFKLKLIRVTIYHIWFIVKVLWKCYERNTSLFYTSDMFYQLQKKKNIYIYIYLLGGPIIFIANNLLGER